MPDTIRVLMVDDEDQFRATTSKILKRRGYETRVAATGEEAIGLLEESPSDVVILDIKMPGMSGHDVLQKVKTIRPDAQVIMLTGHGTLDSAKESLEKGAFDYLNKPCDIDLLDSRIKDAYSTAHKDKKREMKTGDIMISLENYTTIDAEKSVREGIEALKKTYESFTATGRIMETGHRSIVALDGIEKVVGILSIRDLIEWIQPAYLYAPKPSMADSIVYSPMFWSGMFTNQVKVLADVKIKDVMSEALVSVEEDATLMETANLMYAKGIRRMIVTRKGKPVGVVREQEIFFEIARIILGR